jgi:phage tail sheath protein FI
VKVFSTFDGLDRWYDPAIFGARQMAFTDAVADSWFAPAGFRRGRLTKPTEVEVKLNQGDRDSLYSGGNVVNPIVSFPQQGITIFGQRTTQRSATALDRINIRRLMIYIRKVILAATQRFVFEPNDEFTWSQIEGVLNPFLDDIRRRRGITEFRVVCDSSVNTPFRIDRNELWTKVLIKPTKTAEILIFEINLTNQSAQLGSL